MFKKIIQIVTLLIVGLFFTVGQVSAADNPTSGTLTASTNSAVVGTNVTVTITASDGDGIEKVCLTDCKDCQNATNCAQSWQITQAVIGSFYAEASVCAKNADTGVNECSRTNPEGISIDFSDLTVSCSASPSPVQTNNNVTFTATVSGGTGTYSYAWTGDCTGTNPTCAKSFSSAGTFTPTLTVVSGTETKTVSCSAVVQSGSIQYISVPQYIPASCNGCGSCGSGSCNGYSNHSYSQCYDEDVYWYCSNNIKNDKKEECGSDSCDQWTNYCSSGNVYKKRNCYDRGCNNAACFSTSKAESEFVENCSSLGCENGKCVVKPACECSFGPCCDGCYYKPSTSICETKVEIQYGCLWGTGCGADVAKRSNSTFRYCSGASNLCLGEWKQSLKRTSWTVVDYCSVGETCSVGKSACSYNSACTRPVNTYIKNYTKKCSEDNLFWYDSNNLKQGKYRDCADENDCTSDSCDNNKCANELKCDGTACSVGSDSYCESCESCGDDVCNCNETPCGCPADCKISGLSVSVLCKEAGESTDWSKDIKASPSSKLDVLLVVTNSGQDDLEDVSVEVNLPKELKYQNDLKIGGDAYKGDIALVNVGDLSSGSSKTITLGVLTGRILDDSDFSIAGTVSDGNLKSSDSVKISLAGTGASGIAAVFSGTAFSISQWQNWQYLFWLATIALVAFGAFYIFPIVRKKKKEAMLKDIIKGVASADKLL